MLFITSLWILVLVAGLGLVVINPTLAQLTPQPTPLPLYALPNAQLNSRVFNTNTMAVTGDGRTLVVANLVNNTVSIVSPGQSLLVAEIPTGIDPRTVTITPDDSRALVINRRDATLAVIGLADQSIQMTIPLDTVLPYGVVTDDNNVAYVSAQGTDEILVVDLINQRVADRISVPDSPTGMALWGDFLYITHFWSGAVSLVYLPQRQIVSTVRSGLDTGLSQSIDIDITRGLAYLPQTRSNAQNRALTFDTIVFPVVNVFDLRDLVPQYRERIALDVIDQPVNMPFAVAVDRFREWLYVANAGSNDITAIDLANGRLRGHIEVDSNPRGLLLSPDNSKVYVHNTLDGTLTIIDANTLQILDSLPISNLTIPVDILIGAQLFYTAKDARLSADLRVSCANCHFDGQADGRTWIGFADGPRNTPLLYNLVETAPYTWSGTWDELADVELKIRDLAAGMGLIDGEIFAPLGDPHSGLSLDLDTLVIYLTSLQEPLNPSQIDPERVTRGAVVFEEQNCAQCHVGPAGTNLEAYDVGTGKSPLERAGTTFNTPALRGLWMSAPYFHDGSALTLKDVFALPGAHQLVLDVPPEDIEALVAYLLAWPQSAS